MTAEIVQFQRPPEAVVPLAKRHGPQSVASLWELYLSLGCGTFKKSTMNNTKRSRDLCSELKMPPEPGPADVAMWIEQVRGLPGRRGKLMASSTVTLYRDCLHAMFEWAGDMGRGWTSEVGNPVALTPHRRTQPLRVALREVESVWPMLLAAVDRWCTGDDLLRARAFVGVLRFGGLRKGEALALRRSDIDTRSGSWVLRVTCQRDASEWVVKAPKTERARRPVMVRGPLRELLEPVLSLPDPTVKVGLGGGDRRQVPFLFPYRAHELKLLMTIFRGVDPEGFTPNNAWHVFRHTCAVDMSLRGMPVETISEWLGHVDVQKTQTYLRQLSGGRVNADLMEKYFDDEGPPVVRKSGALAALTAKAPKQSKVSSSSRRPTVKSKENNR